MKTYRDTIKLSDYLNNILVNNERIAKHNTFIEREINRLVRAGVSSNDAEARVLRMTSGQGKKSLLHVPSESELEDKFGGKFEDINILAKIGQTGQKIHKVVVRALNTPDGYILYSAYSECGSQKWGRQGKSPIFPFGSNDLSFVNCDKCRGIRVQGGKAPEPSKRKVIDPDSRPKEFHYTYLVDVVGTEWHSPVIGQKTHDQAKGMTAQEAQDKIYKKDMRTGYYSKVYGFEVDRIYAWNGKLLWKKT